MELASKLRWILVIAVTAIALILVCWGLLSIARNTFGGDDIPTEQQEETTLESTNTASFSVDGPVVANSLHRSYRIDVSERVVTMTVFGSYGASVLDSKSYQNTSVSYNTFLSALDNADVTARARRTSSADDFQEVGVCASGSRFVLELDEDLRRWSTTCGDGTAGFDMSAVESLFQLQVPDFDTLIGDTGL